jgi:hypothetical protein
MMSQDVDTTTLLDFSVSLRSMVTYFEGNIKYKSLKTNSSGECLVLRGMKFRLEDITQ